jgi:hypothetical protein
VKNLNPTKKGAWVRRQREEATGYIRDNIQIKERGLNENEKN